MVKTGTIAEAKRRSCLGNSYGLDGKLKEKPLDPAIAGLDKAVRSSWTHWSQLELNKGVLYLQWEETKANAVTRQLIVPQTLIPPLLPV